MEEEPRTDEVDELFASLGESDLNDESALDPGDDEMEFVEVERRPLQFSLRALFAALSLSGFFSLTYLYRRPFGFLLFFIAAAYVGARARGSRERTIATMFFGGAAAFCGGLMMGESSRAAVGIMGLVVACLGAYAVLHGVALVIASFWE